MSLAALDQKFSILDDLPETLYATVITNTHGELLTRVEGIMQWRHAFLLGELPDEKSLVWPEPETRRIVLKRLEVLQIVAYCRDQEELTDSILKDICEGIVSAEDFYKKTPGGFVDKLAQKQNIRDRETPFDDPENLADHVANNNSGAGGSSDQTHEKDQLNDDQSDEDRTQQEQQDSQARQSGEGFSSNQTDENEAQEQGVDQHDVSQQPIGVSEQPDDQQQADQRNSQQTPDNSINTVAPALSDELELGEELTSGSTQNASQQIDQVEIDEQNSSFAEGDDLTGNIQEQSERLNYKSISNPAEHVADHLEKRWSELADNWHELAETFSELSGMLGRGWDLTQGVLAAQGWRDIVRYRRLIKQLPELKALLNTLGRLKEISGDETKAKVCEEVFNPIKRMQKDEDDTITPHVTMETGGIERSGEISRMLPSELALLGHPKLNLLWHAKRAENMLMTYRYSGVMPEEIEREKQQKQDGQVHESDSSLGAGPVIVCLDTSGSMQGEPEQIAKALVLEALRIAWQEQRTCFVYSFGGPDEILEHELNLTQGGIVKLLDFLQMSFHGGTDVTKPLLQALEKQASENWQQADILLITDGRFPAKIELFSKIKNMKQQQQLRIHGLILGDWQGNAIDQICEPLHRFNDWQEFREGIQDHAV